MVESITVTINGRPEQVARDLTVARLLDHLGLTGQPLVIEKNLSVVLKSEWAAAGINAGDRIEFIRVVAGG